MFIKKITLFYFGSISFCIHFKWGTLSEGQGTDPVNSAFLLYACHVFKEGEL